LKVVIDTSALMVPAEWGLDIFMELSVLGYDECFVPSAVKDELDRLEAAKKVDRVKILLARAMMEKCKLEEAPGPADDAVLSLSKRLGAAAFTNDAALRTRLKRDGVRTVFLRGRQKLAVD
jgi:rRNA-processing protein FCF1